MVEWIVVAALIAIVWMQISRGSVLEEISNSLGRIDVNVREMHDDVRTIRAEIEVMRSNTDDIQERVKANAETKSERERRLNALHQGADLYMPKGHADGVRE